MSQRQWYYRLDGRAHGPFNAIQFEKLIRGKTVTAVTEVSGDGETWRSLAEALAGGAEEPARDHADSEFMGDTTLMPGEVRLPADWKTQK